MPQSKATNDHDTIIQVFHYAFSPEGNLILSFIVDIQKIVFFDLNCLSMFHSFLLFPLSFLIRANNINMFSRQIVLHLSVPSDKFSFFGCLMA